MNRLGNLTKVYLGLIVFALCGSLLSRLTGLDPGPIAPITSGLTLLVGVYAALRPAILEKRQWSAVFMVLLAGGLIEVVGMKTGLPFGSYEYTDRWLPVVKVGGSWFPLLVPFAWLLVAGTSYLFALKLIQDLNPRGSVPSIGLSVPLGAGIATLVDLPMEWAMTTTLNYWVWEPRGPLPGGAAIMNPFGWFLTSLLACFVFHRFDIGRSVGRLLPDVGEDATWVLLGHTILVLGLGAIGLIPGR